MFTNNGHVMHRGAATGGDGGTAVRSLSYNAVSKYMYYAYTRHISDKLSQLTSRPLQDSSIVLYLSTFLIIWYNHLNSELILFIRLFSYY